MSAIRGILDASALISYTKPETAMPVGELIQQIEEDDEYVGIPVSAFVTAYAQVHADEHARRVLLALAADASFASEREDRHQSVFVMLPLPSVDAVEVGEYEARWPGQGQVIREAEKCAVYGDDKSYGAIVASYDPPAGEDQLPPGVVFLDLSAGWDDIGSVELPE